MMWEHFKLLLTAWFFLALEALGSARTTMLSISADWAKDNLWLCLLIFRAELTCLSDREVHNLFLGEGELHEAALGLGLGPGDMVGTELTLCGFQDGLMADPSGFPSRVNLEELIGCFVE